jgi:hypothetical protein
MANGEFLGHIVPGIRAAAKKLELVCDVGASVSSRLLGGRGRLRLLVVEDNPVNAS